MPRPVPEHLVHAAQALLTPRRCLAAAYAFYALMIAIGAIPGKASAASALVYDKLLHLLAYMFLSSLLYMGLQGSQTVRAMRTLLIVGLLGALDEAIQALMPYRDANLIDWQVDMLAAFLSVLFMMLVHPIYAAATRPRTGRNIE